MQTIEVKVIALNETEYWELPEYEGKIEEIRTYYWYNPAEVTYLCEITPSYCLYPYCQTEAWLKEEFMDDDDLRDEIDNVIQVHSDNEVTYMHCHSVDKMKSLTLEIEVEDDYQEDEDWERKFEDAVWEEMHKGLYIKESY